MPASRARLPALRATHSYARQVTQFASSSARWQSTFFTAVAGCMRSGRRATCTAARSSAYVRAAE
eukprot:CAMPEP_0119183544 /NCGR_PEP_ID=MMETSP1315-20130426/64408_1 /TAXON_ID=676789 /ORGANISM="Prasinoderma singularis, Strain RCC927" /LENGTH=64 /DNA_ID=CAMNT_0007177925 /DNA_START=348 /DNA_END=539 /DNA_ORIENTATION=+